MNVRFKVLKHKTIADAYGQPNISEGRMVMAMSPEPQLFPNGTSLEALKSAFTEMGQQILLDKLEEYDLVDVSLMFIT